LLGANGDFGGSIKNSGNARSRPENNAAERENKDKNKNCEHTYVPWEPQVGGNLKEST